MTLLAELEEFVGDHRPHGTLTCDATEPAWNGYQPTIACPRGVGGQGVVGAVIGNEFLQVGEEGHWVTALLPREFVGINHAQPSLK